MKSKIVCFSDTHGSESELDVGSGDILVFCGDFGIGSMDDLLYANRWFGKQNYTHKIFVAGNHDTYLEGMTISDIKLIFDSVTYLQDEMVEIDGIKFYGSPYTPMFNNWAFMLERCSPELKDKWSDIPYNLDFLVTHGPAYNILDRCQNGERVGCEVLQRAIFEKNPKYHLFGHIHHNNGCERLDNNTMAINCSLLDDSYVLKNNPKIIEFSN